MEWTGSIKTKGQHEHFSAVLWSDQHGRRWACAVDDISGHPVGMLTPDGWTPPTPHMVPPQKYIVTVGGKFSGRLNIDYTPWITDWSDAGRQYAQWIVEVAKKNYPADAATQIEKRNPFLMDLAGPPPQSVTLVKAMAAGNPWALGLRKPDGTAYAQPEWADGLTKSWAPVETDGGLDHEQEFSAEQFPNATADLRAGGLDGSAFVPDVNAPDWFADAAAAGGAVAVADLVVTSPKRGR